MTSVPRSGLPDVVTVPPAPALAFAASERPEAQAALARLTARYGQAAEADADVIVALGGDGFMLETLHRNLTRGMPVYGMNRGSVGFLLNDYDEDGLIARIAELHSYDVPAITV